MKHSAERHDDFDLIPGRVAFAGFLFAELERARHDGSARLQRQLKQPQPQGQLQHNSTCVDTLSSHQQDYDLLYLVEGLRLEDELVDELQEVVRA